MSILRSYDTVEKKQFRRTCQTRGAEKHECDMRAHQVSGGGKWPPPRRVSTACPQRGMRHWQRWGVEPAQYRPKGGQPSASLQAGENRTGERKCSRGGSVGTMTHRNDGCDGGMAPTPPGFPWRDHRPVVFMRDWGGHLEPGVERTPTPVAAHRWATGQAR